MKTLLYLITLSTPFNSITTISYEKINTTPTIRFSVDEIKKQVELDIKFYKNAELKNGYAVNKSKTMYQLTNAHINLMRLGVADTAVERTKRFLLNKNKATKEELDAFDFSEYKTTCLTMAENFKQNLSTDKSLSLELLNGKKFTYTNKEESLLTLAKEAILEKFPGTKIINIAADADWAVYKHKSGIIEGRNRFVAVLCKLPNELAMRVDYVELVCDYSGGNTYGKPRVKKALNFDTVRFVKE